MGKLKVFATIIVMVLSFESFSQLTSDKQEIPVYFPQISSGNFKSTEVLDSFLNKWYSEQLFALKEPILFTQQNNNIIVYRLTVLRTFANPYTIRVENSNNEITLFWKECDGSGGYEPGNLIKDKKTKLRNEDWEQIEKYIDKIDFWDLPIEDTNYSPPEDGTAGLIEAVKNRKYHITTYWDPMKVNISKLFHFLVSKTDINYKEQRD